jgi:hypothetical protein
MKGRAGTMGFGWGILVFATMLSISCGGGGDDGVEPDPGGNDDPIVDPSTGNTDKPSTFPSLASVGLFSAASPFNTPIGANPAIDANSAALIGQFTNAGALVIQVKQFSSTVFFANASTPRADVPVLCGPVWEVGVSRMVNIPIPPFAEASVDVDGAGNPPEGCGENADQDNNLIILDMVNRCEYDFWQARNNGGSWSASWGNSMSMDDDGSFDNGMSIRGSGFAFLGGLIWPDELQNGAVTHRLVASYPFTKSGGPVTPATDSDGITESDTAIPEGALLQLNPDLDLNSLGLTSYELAIARGLQTYGLMIVDTGGESGIGLYSIDPRSINGDLYGGSLPADDFVELGNIPLGEFRVLQMSAQNGDWAAGLNPGESSCHTWS